MKKFFSMFLIFILLLTGCNSNNKKPGKDNNSSNIKPSADGIYQEGALFQFGLTRIMLEDVGNGYSYGYMNKSGEWVIEPQFEQATEFGPNKLAFVMINGEWRCIDTNGDIASDLVFYGIHAFSACGIAYVQLREDDGSVYSAYFDGKEIKKIENYESLGDFSSEGYAVVSLDGGREGLIDSNYNWVIPPTQGLNLNSCSIQNGLCAFTNTANETCGFYDKNGSIAILSPNYYRDFYQGVIFSKSGLAVHNKIVYDKNWNKVFDISSLVENGNYYVSSCFASSDWMSLRREPKSTSYGAYMYIDAQGNIMAHEEESDRIHLTIREPSLIANRICLYHYVELDDEGKAVALSDARNPNAVEMFVVLNEKAEFVYSPDNLEIYDLRNYYTDGYTWGEILTEGGNSVEGVFAILDQNGNIIWRNNKDTPIASIG